MLHKGPELTPKTPLALLVFPAKWVAVDRETAHRRDQADALAEKHGARIEQVYWTMGHYDAMAILEAPDDESASAFMLDLTSAGGLRTSTLRTYDHDQMQAIIQRVG